MLLKFKSNAIIFILLLMSPVIVNAGGSKGFSISDPSTLSECVGDEPCLRMLWPEDASAPGMNLTALSGGKSSSETIATPLGGVEATSFDWKGPAGTAASSRHYRLPVAGAQAYVIEVTVKQDISAPTGKWARTHFALPSIVPPKGLDKVLNYKEETFAPPAYTPAPTMGPMVLFNNDLDVVIVSSLDHFLSSIQSPFGGAYHVGFQGEIKSVPAGTMLPIVIVKGRGINATMQKWGDILRAWHGKEVPSLDADIGLRKLGYWTDNGAYYYYNTIPGMNYHDTLIAVKRDADERGIPYGYFQIDSWWYPKAEDVRGEGQSRGGAHLWEPMEELFPQGLGAFVEELGLPLIAHNRWYDYETPYCEHFECVPGEGPKMAALPIEPEFWDVIMDNAVSYGVVVYEQDWLHTQYFMVPWLREGIGNAESWFDAMIDAADRKGLTVQLCMANPGFFLQSVKHRNITQVRTSRDYHAYDPKTKYWPKFHTANMLARAVGMYPFKDNFHTVPGQHAYVGERRPYEETLISVLSAGPVGPGDKIGISDADLLMKTCMKDGTLLKPDRPATTIDRWYVKKTLPLIVSAESSHDIGVTIYVAGFNLNPLTGLSRTVALSDLGVSGEHVIWNYREQTAVKSSSLNFGTMRRNDASYHIVCPVLDNGMAFIGEIGKFTTAGTMRFKSLRLDGGGLVMDVSGVPGEEVSVLIYNPHGLEGRDTGGRPVSVTGFGDKLSMVKFVIGESGTNEIMISAR